MFGDLGNVPPLAREGSDALILLLANRLRLYLGCWSGLYAIQLEYGLGDGLLA
jgi:hypothetical protein